LPITLVALGSYGREELCVYSDIDLMIVYKDIKGYNITPIIQTMLHLAWDAGLKLGHRTHEVKDLFNASNEDITIKTAMMESRFLCGSKYLFTEIQNELEKIRKYNKKEFIAEKIKAYQKRKEKYPLTMQPNIKDGVGGFRDANTLFWIAHVLIGIKKLNDLVPKYLSEEEFREFRSALEFLFRLRSALHLSAGKKQDVLNLDFIPNVADKLGFRDTKAKSAQIQVASKTLESLWILKITCQIFIKRLTNPLFFDRENIKKLMSSRLSNNFYLYNGTLFTSFRKKPLVLKNVLKLILKLDDKPMKFDISVIHWLKQTKIPEHNSHEIYELFKKLFQKEHFNQIIYAFYKANLLHHLIKPLSHTINLPQFDGYHSYPVDIHSIKTLKFLENIDDVFVKALYDDICENGKVMLRLVCLLHDVGKGRSSDHSKLGAKIFRSYATKLGLNNEQIEMGTLLIKYHTIMSNTASREDIYNEKTILSFVSKIKSPQALKLLYILTYCDVNAVSVNVYSKFNAKLLRELYDLSLEAFEQNTLIDETTRRLKKEEALLKNSDFKNLQTKLQKKIISSVSNLMFFKYSPSQIVKLGLWADETKEFSYKIENDENLSLHVIRNIDFNISYLLAKLVIFDLAEMDIFKLFGNTKYFKIDFNKKADESELFYIESLIVDSFAKDKKATIKKPIILKNEIGFDCNHSKSLAKVDFNIKDQAGLMSYVISIFDEYKIDIASAKIQTIKNRARNMFLIEKDTNLCDNIKKVIEIFYKE
jgi:[protein-PII] uridylyltransferase